MNADTWQEDLTHGEGCARCLSLCYEARAAARRYSVLAWTSVDGEHGATVAAGSEAPITPTPSSSEEA